MESVMTPLPHESAELTQIYGRRFDAHVAYRNKVWKVLTTEFFARYIGPGDTVLDLGCGYGEFINNMRCGKKYAMDLNPAAKKYLLPEAEFLQQDCSQPWSLTADSLDVVFTSNFFEHLPSRKSLADTLLQAKRCAAGAGSLLSDRTSNMWAAPTGISGIITSP